MAEDGPIAGLLRQRHRFQRFGQGAHLVGLDEDGIGGAAGKALLQPGLLGDKKVIPDELNIFADGFGELPPQIPVILPGRVLQRNDGVLGGKTAPVFQQVVRGAQPVFLGQEIHIVPGLPLSGGSIQRQRHILPGAEAAILDGPQNQFQGLFLIFQLGGKAALISHAAGQARFLQQGAQPVGDPHTALQPIGKGGTAQRDDHKFLDIDIIGGVAAAIQNIHHGAGQSGPPPRKAGEVLPQRQAAGSRGGVGHGQADPQNGIGAEVRFISGAIRFAEDAVNGFLLGSIPPDEGPGQFVINGMDGGAHPFSAVTGWVAVPFFAGFVPAGGSAAGDGCDAYGTALQGDLHPDGRVAAAIQNFEALYFGNGGMGHGFLLLVLWGRRDGAARSLLGPG